MLQHCIAFLLFLNAFTIVLTSYDVRNSIDNVLSKKTYAIWRNATVPFYVNPEHFDHEQTLGILSALAMFAFKTCIKFKPVMARPDPNDEVMVFYNPGGSKRCQITTWGHSEFNPHFVNLGYECMKSPQIDMMIMRALGFPFEHNRDSRDLYIQVLNENIEPGYVELFTKEDVLPLELRFLPYDVNSVMHFDHRDYSKNGHRTIMFKDSSVKQARDTLTNTDIRKIEIVYGPECRARDRQEKIELCQSYPGVARRRRQTDGNDLGDEEPIHRQKRDIDPEKMATKNLRVNPNITPPPGHQTDDITKTLNELGINDAVDDIVDQVYKVSALALKNARKKYCNDTNNSPGDVQVARVGEDSKARNASDILGIIEVVADFASGMVNHAIQNLTEFCENSKALEAYQRYSCGSGSRDPRCRDSYKSTKSGPVMYSTNHRPIIEQSTNHNGGKKASRNYARKGNVTDEPEIPTTLSIRRKRDAETTTEPNNEDKPKSTTADNNKTVEESLVKATTDKKVESKTEKNADDVKNISNENKEKTTEDIKEKAADKKEKAVEVETDDIKVKSDEKVLVNNKDQLRLGTRFPTLNRNNYNRRSPGDDSEHSDASPEDLDALDTILAKKIVQKKHIIQKKIRKQKKRDDIDTDGAPKVEQKVHHKKKRKEHLAIPAEAYVKNEETYSEDALKANKEGSEEDNENEKIEPAVTNKHKKRRKKKVKQEESDAEANTMIESETDPGERPVRPRKKKTTAEPAQGLPRTVVLSKKNQDFYSERRWPNGKLVYMIQVDTTYDLSDMRRRLGEVGAVLKDRTCVRMKEIKPGEANKYDDYIVIDNSPDYVTGRVGGKQKFGSIELFRGGQHRQHASMMVMAMLGFYFEVSRHDRDKFIRVHMRHVRPDKLHHFEMIRSDATLPLPYDYASATHPAWQFWRQMGRTGISTVATFKEKDPDGSIMKTLGQNENILSDLDIVKINSVYGIDCFRRPRASLNPAQKNDTIAVLVQM